MLPSAFISASSVCRSPLRAAARMRSRVRSTAGGRRERSLATPAAGFRDGRRGGSLGAAAPPSWVGGTNCVAGGGAAAPAGGLIVSVRTLGCARAAPPQPEAKRRREERQRERLERTGR